MWFNSYHHLTGEDAKKLCSVGMAQEAALATT